MTIVFVMIAEVLIFLPSVANFRKNWLMARLNAAQIAALAVEAAPDNKVPEMLHEELLKNAQVYGVALRRASARQLVLPPKMPGEIERVYDLRNASAFTLIKDALALLINTKPGFVYVIGVPKFGSGILIEAVIDEGPSRDAAIQYALNILQLSIFISVMTAILVYLSLNALLVRPMTRITRNMVEFSQNPENHARIMQPSHRTDEIGIAERELAKMQTELHETLSHKSRLAALGLAVSKINHDLRNMLSSAQLVSDRLSSIQDETVQRFTPRLLSSLDRAIRLCTDTLKYGQAPEPTPQCTVFHVLDLVEEVGQSLELSEHKSIAWNVTISPDIKVYADRDHIYRALGNLCRNAVQILENSEQNTPKAIHITAEKKEDTVRIDVEDSGPGVPENAKKYLFDAFKGSLRKGGTGLGLAISSELIKAHGGCLQLTENSTGAKFRITLPQSMHVEKN
ncbi:MAG: HAMP domain-containing sensor histidine kinase [Pseudomonadota bacterium]